MKSLYKSPAILKNEITFVTRRDGFNVETAELELFEGEREKAFERKAGSF